MKKIAALMLAILLLLCAVSCVDNGDGVESSSPEENNDSSNVSKEPLELPYVVEMSETVKYMIESDWKNYKGEDIVWFDAYAPDYEATRYYGIFGNNCYILFYHVGWDLEFDCAIEIEDETFSHSEMFEIYVYKNNFFYDLSEAYELEIISLPEIMILADIHAEFESTIKSSK